MTLIIALAVFVTVAALALALQYREQERVGFGKERLARATGQGGPPVANSSSGRLTFRTTRISGNESVSRLLANVQFTRTIEQKLLRSDWKLRVSDFLVRSALVGIIAFGIVYRLSGSSYIAGGAGVVGLFIPRFLLNRNINKRRNLFNNQMIEVLTQMSNSLKAGFGLLQAIQQASNEAKHPISTELKQLLNDIQVGSSVEDAFNDLSYRVGSDDLDIVITAILIQRGAGGSLAEIIEGVAHTMRERIRIRGEINTLTTQGKYTGYLIGALPIILGGMFYVVNARYISLLWTTDPGKAMLVGWAVLQGFGFFVIRRILNIEL
ncbi:MAG: type II secretion system F family protein [Dehalococcoidia bacterium]